jgi:type VII secretion-associated serine protease mycosin
MTQKLILGLTVLLAINLVWFVSSFVNVQAARLNTATYAVVLSPPEAALAGRETSTTKLLVSQQAVTTTYSYFLYLPLISRDFCANAFSFNETIRYNLDKINIQEGWRCYQGQGVTVAVIDTGIDLDHPDLQANIVAGKSFVSGVSSPDDDGGHGTHVAGVVAAVNNNGGVIGVAPAASLMPVKVLDSQGNGSTYNVAAGIEWAADHGATVINLSLGSVSSSSTLKAALDYAYNRGVLLVAAGGNCGDSAYFLNGCSYQDQPVYPAAYANVMAVASTDSSDNQSSFSNQGSYIEIAAPGSSIYSTYPSSGYTTLSGTSMATPHVAGLAALIWSQNPSWSNEEVRAQIRNTAQDLGASGRDNQFGYGRINAAEAMSAVQTTSVATAAPAEASPLAAATQAAYVPGEILLKLRTGFTVNRALDPAQLAAADVKVADTIEQIGVQKLTLRAGQEQALLTQLLNSGAVEYAELNYVVTIQMQKAE